MAIDQDANTPDPTSNPHRPVLTHLTADTSWLISLPQITQSRGSQHGSRRSYFHILLDPWFNGEVVSMSRWVIAFEHTIEGKCQSMDDVRQVVLQLENSARGGSTEATDDGEVDMVLVSHYLPDHCHPPSLEQVSPDVPVLTVDRAVQMIQGCKHFETVEAMPEVDLASPETLWTSQPTASFMPKWLRVGRLPSGQSYPQLHFGTLIAFTADRTDTSDSGLIPDTILYTPHGIYADRLGGLETRRQQGKSSMLAVLHGLDPAWSPMQANLGVDNGYQIALKTQSKYWIPTHDEHLKYKGIVGMMQTKYKMTFADALPSGVEFKDNKIDGLICRELANGESFVLV